MNNHQFNALETLDLRAHRSLKNLEQAYHELHIAWAGLKESYEGQGAEEADMQFQLLAGQVSEYQHTLEKLMMQCSREIAELKEKGEAHAT
ncbi:hypothetical protein [Photobacterium galatheae]|uniref:Uncharacterized protein n=1 Tax=Photobacterium galatheae TaxID=1654360 RepID=A0A066RL68_9GAMM|nr:hypothetical protein [Photobacterium galatheae]KDM89866.1 hypothetical protein EA58_20665 [Photobacterium galatheae]MCM0151161.1 hypothetical protein [Photobacterium galatheae]